MEVWGATVALGERFWGRASNESEVDVVLASPAFWCVGLGILVSALACECAGSTLCKSGVAVVRLPTLIFSVSLAGLLRLHVSSGLVKSACAVLLVSLARLLVPAHGPISTTHDWE